MQEAHAEETARRAREVREVLAIHDTTPCQFAHADPAAIDALLTLLAVSLPIACEILALRATARENPDRPAAEAVNPLQVQILRRLGTRPLSEAPTVQEVLFAVAAMGGHQRDNGEPGWLVLQRGMTKLLAHEEGWRAALAAGAEDL